MTIIVEFLVQLETGNRQLDLNLIHIPVIIKQQIMWVGAEETVSKLGNRCLTLLFRSEGPALNRPDRKVGIGKLNAEERRRCGTLNSFVSHLWRSFVCP
jgi:hypothetical protein